MHLPCVILFEAIVTAVIDLQRRRYDKARMLIKTTTGIDVEREYNDIVAVDSPRERSFLVDMLRSLGEKAR